MHFFFVNFEYYSKIISLDLLEFEMKVGIFHQFKIIKFIFLVEKYREKKSIL